MNQFIGDSPFKKQPGIWAGVLCLLIVFSSLVASSVVLFAFPLAGAYMALRKDRSNVFFAMVLLLLPVTLSSAFLSFDTVTIQLWVARFAILLILPLMIINSDYRQRDSICGGAFTAFFLFGMYVTFSTSFVSLYPSVSIQKSVFFTCFILTLLYAARFGEANVRPLLGWIGAIIFSSIVVYFVYPSIGFAFTVYEISESDGRYSGILGHPQTLAPVIALALPLIVYMICLRRGLAFWGWSSAFLGAFILLFLTSSRTGMVASLFAVVLMAALLAWRSLNAKVRGFAIVFLMGSIALGALLASLKWDVVQSFAFKAKDATEISFSGRDQIVAESWEAFSDSPLIGNGFQVPSRRGNYGDVNFETGGSRAVEKSFFITMTLEETGLIGFALAMTGIILLYLSAWRRNALIFLATFSTFLLVNCGEATLFSPSGLGGLGWILCMATFCIRV